MRKGKHDKIKGMLASAIYFLILKDRDWSFGKKFALGILAVYVLYYLLYYLIMENTIFQDTFYWVVGGDIFLLGVLLMKYKNMKFGSFVNKAVARTL